MYHEEKWIDGILHWRSTPDGGWHPAGLDLLNRRLREEKKRSKAVEILREVKGGIPPWLYEYKIIDSFLTSLECEGDEAA